MRYGSIPDHHFFCISGLESSNCDSAVNSFVLQNNRNLHPPVSVEVSVREIRQIQQLLPESDFRFLLCPPVFKFLRVSFSRARSSVTFP